MRSNRMKSMTLTVFGLLLPLSLASQAYAGESNLAPAERVRNILSNHHVDKTAAEIEALVGGEDTLVQTLIAARLDKSVPFVSMRAEKMLLTNYSSRADVIAILKEDLTSGLSVGFARTIVANLDRVSDPAARAELGRLGLEKAFADAEFVPYARMMSFSTDPALRALGDQLPQVVQ